MPKLDRKPSGRPHDWSYRRMKVTAVKRPSTWKNSYANLTVNRDQQDRGTCVGQSTAYSYDLLYMMLTKDVPTDIDKQTYKQSVTDSLGTLTDKLFKDSSSAEGFYQKSREIGGIHDGEGSETRYAGAAWVKYGMNLESQWHTAKTPYNVWEEPQSTTDGGISKEAASTFASLHKANGWAMVGDENGNSSWDEVCDAIYEKGFVIAGIPVYENYDTMQGGDGRFPNPKGSIVGYHALCFYGYDDNNIYLLHSWGSYCSKYGSLSKQYFDLTTQESIYIVILDDKDTLIGKDTYASLTITTKDKSTKQPIQGDIYVNGVKIGKSPQKIAVELGKYSLEGRCIGYKPLKETWTMKAKTKKNLSLSLSLKHG